MVFSTSAGSQTEAQEDLQRQSLVSGGSGSCAGGGGSGANSGAGEAHPLDRWMERASISVGTWQRLQVLVCALGVSSEAAEVLCISYILPSLPDEFVASSGWSKSGLSAAVFAGMLIGGALFGFAADAPSVGRRPCLLAATALNCGFGIFAAAAPSFGALVAARTVAGIGVGGSVPVVFALAREALPPGARGKYMVYVASGWMCGSVYVAVAAWCILGNGTANSGGDGDGGGAGDAERWRLVALAAAAPALLCFLLGCAWLDESSRILYDRCRSAAAAADGRHNARRELARVLARMQGRSGRRPWYGCMLRAACLPAGARHRSHLCCCGRSGVALAQQSEPLSASALCAQHEHDVERAIRGGEGADAGARSHASAATADDTDLPLGLQLEHELETSLELAQCRSLEHRSPGHKQEATVDANHQLSASEGANDTGSASASSPLCTQHVRERLQQTIRHARTQLRHMSSTPARARVLLRLLAAWAALSYSWYGLILWIPTIFDSVGFNLHVYQSAMLVAAANLPGNLVSAWVIDRIGACQLCVYCMGGAAAWGVVLALASAQAGPLALPGSVREPLAILGACGFNAFSTAAWNAIDVLSTEAFDSRVRGSALSVCMAMGRIASLAAQIVNGRLLAAGSGGTWAMLALTACMMFVGTLSVFGLSR